MRLKEGVIMMINIGLENYVNTSKIYSIQKILEGSRTQPKLLKSAQVFNMAGNKKARSLIVMADNTVIRSFLSPQAIVKRIQHGIDAEFPFDDMPDGNEEATI